jgi:hypothetical protein
MSVFAVRAEPSLGEKANNATLWPIMVVSGGALPTQGASPARQEEEYRDDHVTVPVRILVEYEEALVMCRGQIASLKASLEDKELADVKRLSLSTSDHGRADGVDDGDDARLHRGPYDENDHKAFCARFTDLYGRGGDFEFKLDDRGHTSIHCRDLVFSHVLTRSMRTVVGRPMAFWFTSDLLHRLVLPAYRMSEKTPTLLIAVESRLVSTAVESQLDSTALRQLPPDIVASLVDSLVTSSTGWATQFYFQVRQTHFVDDDDDDDEWLRGLCNCKKEVEVS